MAARAVENRVTIDAVEASGQPAMLQSTAHLSALRDSVAAFVADNAPLTRVRRLRNTIPGFERGLWREMAELGWLGILIAEEDGGLGLGHSEMGIVAETAAAALLPEPLCAAAVLAATAIAGSDNEPLKKELLSGLVTGKLIPALAWQERAGCLDPAAISASAQPLGTGFKAHGIKDFVAGAAGADGFAVAARMPDGVALLWVPAGTAGTALDLRPQADGSVIGRLCLSGANVPREHLLAPPGVAGAAIETAIDSALVVLGAELFGVMGRALDISIDYMKTRSQFGKPIGSFQALAHRAVDLHIQRLLADAVLGDAIRFFDAGHAGTKRRAMASRAKARCSDAALRITRESIQIHGAIGFTDEYDIGLYLKRALVLSAALGNAAFHRRRYIQLSTPAGS